MKVKVSEENGAIEIGDRLTVSSTQPGYAIKMTESGQSIGIALESSSGKDKILVFTNLSYQQLSASTDLQGQITVMDSVSSPTGQAVKFHGNAVFAAKLAAENGMWELDENGLLIVREIRADRLTITGEETVGFGRIKAGQIGVDIQNSAVTDKSIIFLSFTEDLAGRTWYISQKSPGSGFTVKLSGNLSYNVDLAYWIINTELDYASFVQSQQESEPIPEPAPESSPETTSEPALDSSTSTSTATTTN